MSQQSLALIADQSVASDDRPIELPYFLRRPDDRAAIAVLTMTDEKEDAEGRGGKRWKLTGSPVAILLATKLMPGAFHRRNDVVSFPVTASGFEDLLMLMHRFPISIGGSARDEWNAHYDDAVMAWELRNLQNRKVGQPTGGGNFTGKLHSFQQVGVDFMLASRRCLLADDMGLGKTVQAFAFLDRVDDWPAVVVCQPHVQRHWETKVGEFLNIKKAGELGLGKLTWTTLRGIKPSAKTPKADLYFVHYLVLAAWEGLLKSRGVRTVIFDEAQEFRHVGTSKYHAVRGLARHARYVVGLSGTPIYNHGIEMHTIMNTINRGCLGSKVDFQEAWCEGGGVVRDAGLLGTYLRDRRLMLRRKKSEVLDDLPEKTRSIEWIDADNAKFADLIKVAAKLAKDALHMKDPFDRARMEAEAMAQTRMATGIAKTPAIIAFLRALMEAEQPTLVFAHHHAVHDAISDALDAFKPASITGRETMAAKAASQAAFQRGETNLCLIALRAATGIDGLQERARVVVFAELDWSPAVHRQAEDRAHRMGQRNSVMVYYLVSDIGVDPHMIQVLGVKDAQFMGIMHEEPDDDATRARAEVSAKEHMAQVLNMLRGVG